MTTRKQLMSRKSRASATPLVTYRKGRATRITNKLVRYECVSHGAVITEFTTYEIHHSTGYVEKRVIISDSLNNVKTSKDVSSDIE